MGEAPENCDSGVWAKLRADIIRTPTRSGVEARLGVSLWGPSFWPRISNEILLGRRQA
jgi:hypothetical protein